MNSETEYLNVVIEEGNCIEGFLGSEAWVLVNRTIQARIDEYRQECYDAAKDSSKNIANFLGRMEALEEFRKDLQTRFIEARAQAFERKRTIEIAIEEAKHLDAAVSDSMQQPMYHKEGTAY